MGDPTSFDVEAQVVRVQRVLDEALDRYVGQNERERSDALVNALRTEVSALPAARRDELVAALQGLYPEPPAPVAAPADGETRRRLEQENERLRDALTAAQAKAVLAPVSVRSGDPVAEQLVKI